MRLPLELLNGPLERFDLLLERLRTLLQLLNFCIPLTDLLLQQVAFLILTFDSGLQVFSLGFGFGLVFLRLLELAVLLLHRALHFFEQLLGLCQFGFQMFLLFLLHFAQVLLRIGLLLFLSRLLNRGQLRLQVINLAFTLLEHFDKMLLLVLFRFIASFILLVRAHL